MPNLSNGAKQTEEIHIILFPKKLVREKAGISIIQDILCASWNVRSLNNKIEHIMNFVVDNNILIFFVTETWLTDQNNNTTAQIKDHGYKIHHSYRSSQSGGGVALIYKNTIQLTKVFIGQTLSFEAVTAKMKMSNNMVVLCSCIYRPPGPLGSFLTDFEEFIANAFEK